MSKRLGNAVDPFETLAQCGPDATRWCMLTNAQPWDNLRFDTEGIGEVQREVLRHPAQHLRLLRPVRRHRRLDPRVPRPPRWRTVRNSTPGSRAGSTPASRASRRLSTASNPPGPAVWCSPSWWTTSATGTCASAAAGSGRAIRTRTRPRPMRRCTNACAPCRCSLRRSPPSSWTASGRTSGRIPCTSPTGRPCRTDCGTPSWRPGWTSPNA